MEPPCTHRRNASERDIRTCYNHFVLGISGTDKVLPIYLWDKLLDQAQITLNMIRTSRLNPKISAHEIMEGNFDFNKTPSTPPNTKFIVHENPNRMPTWCQNWVHV